MQLRSSRQPRLWLSRMRVGQPVRPVVFLILAKVDVQPILKRHAARAIFSTAVGSLVTIALAWMIAAWLPFNVSNSWQGSAGYDDSDDFLAITLYEGKAWARKSWIAYSIRGNTLGPLSPFGNPVDASPLYRPMFHGNASRWTSSWGRLQSMRDATPSLPRMGCENATGWPCLSFWYEFRATSVSNVTVHGGYSLPPSASPTAFPDVGRWRALPFRPIWRGFAIDSLCYGFLTWLVLSACSVMRRRYRAHQGLCPRCNYDLRADLASGCPECGWNKPAFNNSASAPENSQNQSTESTQSSARAHPSAAPSAPTPASPAPARSPAASASDHPQAPA